MIVGCSVAIQTRRRRRARPLRPARADRRLGAAVRARGAGACWRSPARRCGAAMPRPGGRSSRTASSLAALNVTFFEAIDRIPMGIAVTLAFVAPLVMALAASRRRRDVGFALLAAAGVVTLGGLDRPGSMAGVVLAVLTGCAWIAVAYAARSVGSRTRRMDGLALALPVAALLTLPLGVSHFDAIDGRTLAIALVIARRRADRAVRARARGPAPARAAHRRGRLQRRPRHRRRGRLPRRSTSA